MSEMWPAIPVIISENPQELEGLKREFANELLHSPDDSFKAAMAVFGFDGTKALYVSKNWPSDEFVKAEMSRLLSEHGALHFLPTKAHVAREIIKAAKEEKSTSQKLAAWRLYSELMGMMPQKTGAGGDGGQTNVFLGSRNVMVMTREKSDEDWKSAAKANQQRLIEQAAEDLHDPS